MNALELIAIGGVQPSRTVSNDDFAKVLDTSDEWIYSRTGIRTRQHCGEGENSTSLSIGAAKLAIERSGLSPEDIDLIICATVTPESNTPNMACRVSGAIGLREDVPALDINAACTGFIYSTSVALGMLNTFGGKYALVIGCEMLSKVMDMNDRNTCVLFGDGAGAGIYRLTESNDFALTLGHRFNPLLTSPGPVPGEGEEWITMNGREVFRFATDAVPKTVNTILEKSGYSIDDMDYVICHQANERIIDFCIKKLGANPNLFYKNMDHTGNTSSASIPLALNELYEAGKLKQGAKILCVGFGGGFTWGGALIKFTGETK